jgi:hypothetical protein
MILGDRSTYIQRNQFFVLLTVFWLITECAQKCPEMTFLFRNHGNTGTPFCHFRPKVSFLDTSAHTAPPSWRMSAFDLPGSHTPLPWKMDL